MRLAFKQRVADHINGLGAAAERRERGRDILAPPDFKWEEFDAKRARRRLNLAHFQHASGVIRVDEDRRATETSDNLAQEFEALGSKIPGLV